MSTLLFHPIVLRIVKTNKYLLAIINYGRRRPSIRLSRYRVAVRYR